MPAAVTKPVLEAAGVSRDGTVPVRQIMTAVEHKIRNLEKRKVKLEGYQDLRKSGKDLTADQEVAVSKYDEVVQCLLCAQELLKQIQGIALLWEKDAKKIARKETAARVATEVFKVRETLILQELLRQLRIDPNVRNDFATGSNGAVKLDPSDLEIVDKLLHEGFPSLDHSPSEDDFTANAHRAADHWVSTVDGKPKQFSGGVTYEHVRRVVRSIQDCGYFARRFEKTPEQTNATNSHLEPENAAPTTSSDSQGNAESAESSHANDLKQPVEESIANPIPVLETPLEEKSASNDGPGDSFSFNVDQPPMPVADPNSLPEELHSGSFSFLQDCELDSEHQPPQIVETVPMVMGNGLHSPMHHVQPQQPIPTPQPQQPPTANLLLINHNPLMSATALPVAAPADHVVNGGVTPPMFPFAFQNPSVGVPNAPVTALNPVQQLVKTLHANHLHMMQAQQSQLPVEQQPATNGVVNGNVGLAENSLPAAAVPMMMHMNGNGAQPNHAPRIVQNGGGQVTSSSMGFGGTSEEQQNGEEKAAATREQTKQRRRGSPRDVVGGGNEPMTISEWDPAVGTKEAANNGNQHKMNNHQKRETSTESSTGGEGRRPHEERDRRHRHSSGFNGSRRRYMDRGSNGGGGGAGGNGSSNGGSNYHGNNQKSHYRMSTGTTNGGGSSSGGTFYRNNDPNYYSQNGGGGGGMKPGRHSHHQGFSQQQSQRAANN